MVEEPRHVDLLVQHREPVGVELGQVEHVADEPLEPLRGRYDDVERRPLRFGIGRQPLANRLDVPTNGGERRPQLVRDGHEEVPLALLRLAEPGGHLPEAVGEIADLTTAAHLRHRDVVASAGDLVGRLREAEHRLRDPARGVEAEETGDEQAAQDRDGEELHQRHPGVAKLRLRLGDDQDAERRPPHRERPGEGREGAVVGRREVERLRMAGADTEHVDLGAGVVRERPQPGQAVSLARERGHAEVVDAVSRRALELPWLELRRRRSLVDHRLCLPDEQLVEPVRLAPELLQRLGARVVREQLEGDRDGDEAGRGDAGQEERRQPEAQRAQHCAEKVRW